MFYKMKKANGNKASRMRAGAKTPWWHQLITFNAYYSGSTASCFELQVYPDANRALLAGYYNAETQQFTEFIGQVDIESPIVGCRSWKEFIREAKDENYPKPIWKLEKGFEVILMRYGPHWDVTKEQAEAFVRTLPPQMNARIQDNGRSGFVIGTVQSLL